MCWVSKNHGIQPENHLLPEMTLWSLPSLMLNDLFVPTPFSSKRKCWCQIHQRQRVVSWYISRYYLVMKADFEVLVNLKLQMQNNFASCYSFRKKMSKIDNNLFSLYKLKSTYIARVSKRALGWRRMECTVPQRLKQHHRHENMEFNTLCYFILLPRCYKLLMQWAFI